MSMHFKPEDCQLNLQFMTIKPAVTPLTYSLQQIVAKKQTISCLISPAITQKRWLSRASALAILLPGFFFSTLSKGSSPSILSNMWETSKKAVVSSIALYVTHMAPKGRVRVQMGLAIQIRGLRFASNGQQFPTPDGFRWLIRSQQGISIIKPWLPAKSYGIFKRHFRPGNYQSCMPYMYLACKRARLPTTCCNIIS